MNPSGRKLEMKRTCHTYMYLYKYVNTRNELRPGGHWVRRSQPQLDAIPASPRSEVDKRRTVGKAYD